MKSGYYLVMEPDGSIRWEKIQRAQLLDRLYEIICCSCVEQVQTILPDLVMIVDESGKLKNPPKQHNGLASLLYNGWLCGVDDIAGTAVFASLAVDPESEYGERDWFPLNVLHTSTLEMLGYRIPDRPDAPSPDDHVYNADDAYRDHVIVFDDF